jgi:lipid-binding SYLF domain-containing protein
MMMWRGWGLALLLLAAPPAWAESTDALVDRAAGVVQEMRVDPNVDSADLLRRARAVMVVPTLSKGGLLIGGQGGTGMLLVKDQAGGWSSPAFYSITGGTFGLQVGYETAKLVMFVMSDSALQAWLRGTFRFGGQDGVAVLVKGTEVSAKTSQGADVIAWTRASGAFAGIMFEGTDVSYSIDTNRAFYGRIVGAQDILSGTATNPAADILRGSLALGPESGSAPLGAAPAGAAPLGAAPVESAPPAVAAPAARAPIEIAPVGAPPTPAPPR